MFESRSRHHYRGIVMNRDHITTRRDRMSDKYLSVHEQLRSEISGEVDDEVFPVCFSVPGRVIPKERPRVVRGRAYTPARTQKMERGIATLARAAMGSIRASYGPIVATVAISVKRPKSWGVAKCRLTPYPTNERSDLDNVAKTILDACNGIVYVDDHQIIGLHVTRQFSDDEWAEITFSRP